MLNNNRMKTIYGMVKQGDRVCDVGTDHALIPIELLKNGISPFAHITDISRSSLEKGIINAESEGLSDRVEAYCTNGTLGVDVDRVDCVVIAGMGGELISNIIDQDARLKKKGMRFILQPMSRAEELRGYLFSNGFETLKEEKVISDGRVYAVINAEYTGKNTDFSTVDLYFGKNAKCRTRADREYLNKVVGMLNTRLMGLKSSLVKDDTEIEDTVKKLTEIFELFGEKQEYTDTFQSK